MSRVRVLVGTRKGAFVLTSDGRRDRWDVKGPHFGGWEIYHFKGSPADPNRLYVSQNTSWFGQIIQRSNDGGQTWDTDGQQVRLCRRRPGTHKWYDGTPHPWEFARVWHLEPSLADPDLVYAGVEDAGALPHLRRRPDLARAARACARTASAPDWQPGAGGLCLHTILLDPSERRPDVHRDLGRGRVSDRRWRPDLAADQPRAQVRRHSRSRRRSRPLRPSHRACIRSRPNVLFMQKHWDVMRSDDAGDSWSEVSGNLPTDFGFPIDVHAHEPETIYVVPIKSDSEHYPPDGKLRVYRSRTGGNEWEALSKGLPAARLLRERPARRDGRRHARSVRRLLRHHWRAGLRIGQCGRHAGRRSFATCRRCLSVEVQTLP